MAFRPSVEEPEAFDNEAGTATRTATTTNTSVRVWAGAWSGSSSCRTIPFDRARTLPSARPLLDAAVNRRVTGSVSTFGAGRQRHRTGTGEAGDADFPSQPP